MPLSDHSFKKRRYFISLISKRQFACILINYELISQELRELILCWLHARIRKYFAVQWRILQERSTQVGFGINGEAIEKDEEAEAKGAAFVESDPKLGLPHGPSVEHLQGPSFIPICCKILGIRRTDSKTSYEGKRNQMLRKNQRNLIPKTQ
jgi:hypothetical protein